MRVPAGARNQAIRATTLSTEAGDSEHARRGCWSHRIRRKYVRAWVAGTATAVRALCRCGVHGLHGAIVHDPQALPRVQRRGAPAKPRSRRLQRASAAKNVRDVEGTVRLSAGQFNRVEHPPPARLLAATRARPCPPSATRQYSVHLFPRACSLASTCTAAVRLCARQLPGVSRRELDAASKSSAPGRPRSAHGANQRALPPRRTAHTHTCGYARARRSRELQRGFRRVAIAELALDVRGALHLQRHRSRRQRCAKQH